MVNMNCFKAYDIRGKIPDEIDDSVAWCIGRAVAEVIKPKTFVIGGDCRLSTPHLKSFLSDGLRSGGVDVIDIGLCGTEEVYFATSYLQTDGGIMVTASHNPIDYNGMKIVGSGSKPISRNSGLDAIQQLTASLIVTKPKMKPNGSLEKINILDAYVNHLQEYIDTANLRPLRLVVNAGNGTAGHVIDAIEKIFHSNSVPVEFIKVQHDPDGNFPHGIPNPLLPECRKITSDAVREHKADMGIAWDGDFDRCFFFDERGVFIEGYYIVGLLAEAFLARNPKAKIIHDPRLSWNTIDQVKAANGIPVLSKTGHAYIKEMMRSEDAVYGGEMSAHHYFRDFFYCDSGMIPWLLISELVSVKNVPLSELVSERITKYPSSGEINRKLQNPDVVIEFVLRKYEPNAISIDYTDGISVDMGNWRFNLRQSNTEPLVRLNVESRGDSLLMKNKTQELLALLK